MHLATQREATQARYSPLHLAMSHLLLYPEHQMLAHSGHYMTVTSHVPRPVIGPVRPLVQHWYKATG